MTESPEPDPLAFTPVPSASTRHDGWTPERQRRFVAALAAMGVVGAAARAVGKSAPAPTSCVSGPARRASPQRGTSPPRWRRTGSTSARLTGRSTATRHRAIYAGVQVGTVHRFDYRLAVAALRGHIGQAALPLSAEQRALTDYLLSGGDEAAQ